MARTILDRKTKKAGAAAPAAPAASDAGAVTSAAPVPTPAELPRFRVSIPACAEQPIAVLEALSESAAERRYKEAFGIIATDHPLTVEEVPADTPLTRTAPLTVEELTAGTV